MDAQRKMQEAWLQNYFVRHLAGGIALNFIDVLMEKFDVQALIFQNNMVQMKNSFTLDCGKAVFRKTI